VANKLRLLKLPADLIEQLRSANLTERHARALLRLSDADQQRSALTHIIRHDLNVAKTEIYIDRLCRQEEKPRKAIPIYRTKDVRLFLNTIKRSLAIMQSAGVNASYGREESEHEITLTIHIPK
jgi:ParB family chromosome partitioning protein